MFLVGMSKNYDQALLGWKIALFGVASLGMFFYLVVKEFCKLTGQRTFYFVCCHGILFSFLFLATDLIINELKYMFNQFYYMVAGIGWNVFFATWSIIVIKTFISLYKFIETNKGLKATQGKYLFWGMLLGFLSGASASLPAWGINIYPAWHFFTCVYAAISTYAIFKYQLMDIRIVVTRIGVFIAVYTLVLGIPFGLAFGLRNQLISYVGENWWMVPLFMMTALATAGPFIYLYIQRRAEARLLQEQKRYQSTLRQASYGMGRIKDLKRLVQLIVHIVNRTVGIEHSIVYLNDSKTQEFILGAARSRQVRFKAKEKISFDSPLIQHLVESKSPVVYEEIKQRTQDYGDHKLARLEAALQELDAAVVVPSFVDEHLIAFIVLGEKISDRLYTEDDLAVFTILANQAALAIENAQFYEDVKKTHEQLYRAEKMATIGTMADGLSHQINNRLHALGFIAGDALDTIKLKKNSALSPEMKELIIDIEHALTRIQDNVEQGGEIVRGLLRYTRKGEEGFTSVELDKLVEAALEMTQFKIKKGEMIILRQYSTDLPKIKGNFTQLQEVFFNMIDNAYDAMMQRKNEMKESGYQPTIKISATAENQHIDILIEDNGVGIKSDDKKKLFTPFFTTKLSSKKGTGLGLYVIQKIIEENHGGKVAYESEHMKGTKARVVLPIAS